MTESDALRRLAGYGHVCSDGTPAILPKEDCAYCEMAEMMSGLRASAEAATVPAAEAAKGFHSVARAMVNAMDGEIVE